MLENFPEFETTSGTANSIAEIMSGHAWGRKTSRFSQAPM